jgi:hypothetical protein
MRPMPHQLPFREFCSSGARLEMKNQPLWFILCFATCFAVPNPILAQEYRGTFEQQLACTPDVFRFCGSEIPNVNRIVACLRQNTAQLGEACKAVFEAQNNLPKQPPRPNRPAH